MSDRENKGWRTPQTPGAWHTPQPDVAATTGRTSAVNLPADLEQQPSEDGGWHLPRPENTIYTPPSNATAAAALPNTANETSTMALRPEDFDTAPADTTAAPLEPLLAPEDMLFAVASKISDAAAPPSDEQFSMSELVALASLVDQTPTADATPAASGPPLLSGVAAATPDLNTANLSPAERALVQSVTAKQNEAQQTSGNFLSAEDYAKQQLAMLDDPNAAPSFASAGMAVGVAPSGAAATPEDYAKQQLAMLGGDDDSSTGALLATQIMPTGPQFPTANFGAAPAPSSFGVPMPDPATQELADKFRATQAQVSALRAQYTSGAMSREQLETQLRTLMVLDTDQVWWMMGVETDTWYQFVNNEWVPATPPALSATASGAGFAPLNNAPLTYLTDAAPPASPAEYSNELRVDENFMPLPRQVPKVDPNLTQPNTAGIYLRDELGALTQGGAATPNNMATLASSPSAVGPTVPSPAVNVGSYQGEPFAPIGEANFGVGVPSPIEEDEAPPLDPSLSITEEARKNTKDRQRNMILIAVAAMLGLIALVGIGIVGYVLYYYNTVVTEWQDEITALANYRPSFQTARILDADGNLLAELNSQDGGARTPITLSQMSPYLIHAVVATENERFFVDPGVDIIAIGRAILTRSVGDGEGGGASTITQQVVRNLILQNTAPTVERKIVEMIVANRVAEMYSKEQILELYMNEFNFGNLSYGVEAAAQFYFKTPAAALNMTQSAYLAGLIQAPALYDPVTQPRAAIDRARTVIRLMVSSRCLPITQAAWAASEVPQPAPGQDFCIEERMAGYDPTTGELVRGRVLPQIAMIEITRFEPRALQVLYPHFVQFVQAQLENNFGTSEIYNRGFTVRTTLRPALQDAAQQQLSQLLQQQSNTGLQTGAVMITDPNTGAILAMVGSPDFFNEAISGQVNYALTWEQPGSAIKPITYAAALEGVDRNGDGQLTPDEYLTPATLLWDVPTTYANGQPIRNFDNRFRGPVGVRFALAQSLNVPALKAYQFIGQARFVDVAARMGLRFLPDAEFTEATALGATEVRLIDMMRAYGTLANGGNRVELFAINSITDASGAEVLLPARPERELVISPQTAYLMQNILSDDDARAPQFGANSPLVIPEFPRIDMLAAKTGTTNDNRDLWTMGFTSNVVVGVWLGRGDNNPTNAGSLTAAAPVWNGVMRSAFQASPSSAFRNPGSGSIVGERICNDTGTLPGEGCTSVRNEIFDATKPPPPASQAIVQNIGIDTWTGLRANQYCSDNILAATFASISDPFVLNWFNTTPEGRAYAQRYGLTPPLQTPPTQECPFNVSLPIVRLTSPVANQQVSSVVQITGQAIAADMSGYTLEYASASSPNNFVAISSQNTQGNGVLGQWDSASVPNGQYILRLTARSATNGYAVRTVTITTNNLPPTPTPQPLPTLGLPVSTPAPLPFDNITPTFNAMIAPTPTATISFSG
jgi:membrane peptidoglycan carboxypeptidase